MATTHSLIQHVKAKQDALNRFVDKAQEYIKPVSSSSFSLNNVCDLTVKTHVRDSGFCKIDTRKSHCVEVEHLQSKCMFENPWQYRDLPVGREKELNDKIVEPKKKNRIHAKLKSSYEKTVQALLILLEQHPKFYEDYFKKLKQHDPDQMEVKEQYLLQIYLLMKFLICTGQFTTQEDLILHLGGHFEGRKLVKKRTLETQFSDANKAFKKYFYFIDSNPH